MKLSKDTKQFVNIGTKLKDSFSTYIVINCFEVGRSKAITLQDLQTKQVLYSMPISKCYGMNIL